MCGMFFLGFVLSVVSCYSDRAGAHRLVLMVHEVQMKSDPI